MSLQNAVWTEEQTTTNTFNESSSEDTVDSRTDKSEYGYCRTRETYWSADDAPDDYSLRTRKSKRLHALESDRTHPASIHYEYDTPSSKDGKNCVDVGQLTRLVLANFEMPSWVTESAVRQSARALEQERGIPHSNRGGWRLLIVAGLLDVWRPDQKRVMPGTDFHESFKTEFNDHEKIRGSTTEVFRMACEMAYSDGGED